MPMGDPLATSQPMPQMWSVDEVVTVPESCIDEGGTKAPEALAMALPLVRVRNGASYAWCTAPDVAAGRFDEPARTI